jgi:hypothetical protein
LKRSGLNIALRFFLPEQYIRSLERLNWEYIKLLQLLLIRLDTKSFLKQVSFAVLILLASLRISNAQEKVLINVHFLYGSKPFPKYRTTERKWFGGRLGGHVGIETDSNRVLNFMRKGKVHWFTRRKNRRSRFAINTTEEFWRVFRTDGELVKKATVTIPITLQQKALLDSISREYAAQTPYDYAFIGMRCGAATYEILAQLGLMKQYSNRRTYFKIFYPRKLRKRLLKLSEINDWKVIRKEGIPTRNWEDD